MSRDDLVDRLANAMAEEGFAVPSSSRDEQYEAPRAEARRIVERLDLAVNADVVDAVDAAYTERNAIVSALIRATGWEAWTGYDASAPGYTVVYVETPAGQVSWHVSNVEVDRDATFADLPHFDGRWDGHSVLTKYARLEKVTKTQSAAEMALLDDLLAATQRASMGFRLAAIRNHEEIDSRLREARGKLLKHE